MERFKALRKREKVIETIGKWIKGNYIAEAVADELEEQGYGRSVGNMKAVWLDVLEHSLRGAVVSAIKYCEEKLK